MALAATVLAEHPDASLLDAQLVRLSRREARGRLVLGRLAHRFLRGRCHHDLGFARLGDYSRERLGLSPREVQSLARVAAQLRRLPGLTPAFEHGELSWTVTRLLAEKATPEDEAGWIELVRGRPLWGVEAFVGRWRRQENDGTIDGEPRVLVRLPCPGRVKALWREVTELASRMTGSPLAPWQTAQGVAAEGFSARGVDPDEPVVPDPVHIQVDRHPRVAPAPSVGVVDLPDDLEQLDGGARPSHTR